MGEREGRGADRAGEGRAKEQARVLIQASDGSGRGKSKLSTPYKGKFIGCLTADELGMAFGRQTVIHAALASGARVGEGGRGALASSSRRVLGAGRGCARPRLRPHKPPLHAAFLACPSPFAAGD